jgi:transketolase
MPSWELFEGQSDGYRAEVLPPGLPTLAVEAGRRLGWSAWAEDVVSLDRFGASAPAETLFREFGFTAENVAERALRLLRGPGAADATIPGRDAIRAEKTHLVQADHGRPIEE